jgi:hypothetical protein
MASLNLVLCIVWLALGAGLLLYGWLNPKAPRWDLFGTGISAGWLALVLALYNLARWWGIRSAVAQRRRAQEAEKQRRQAMARPKLPPPAEPDPNFRFTE